jgi:dihydroorotate dehydrogenase
LRALDPETAHEAAITALAMGLGPRSVRAASPRLKTVLCGLTLPNPVGLAAGFDKNARALSGLSRMGFGFIEAGTVTPKPQAGNPKPRLFRLADDGAVINRMGFNNAGLDAFVARLRTRPPGMIVGANVGANKDSADRGGDYVAGLVRVWPHADYVTINISSPNTPGLRGLQDKGALTDLLARIQAARAGLAGAKPVFLKVAPDLDDQAVEDVAEIAIAHGMDALIVSNTTIARPDSLWSAHKGEAGGLSGAPLFAPSTQILRQFARAARGRLALIGVGGVRDGATALAKIKAGASAVQLYSALALEGPHRIAAIQADLDARLAAEGFASVRDAVGVEV